MKIKMNTKLKNIDGSTMKDRNAENKLIDATLKQALVNAILAPTEKVDSGVDKVRKYELAKRIFNFKAATIELTNEEVKLCKESVERVFPSPLIVGQIVEILSK